MANTPQAKKRIRRNANRAAINGARVSRIRTFIKAVESALAAGKKEPGWRAFMRQYRELMQLVAAGLTAWQALAAATTDAAAFLGRSYGVKPGS